MGNFIRIHKERGISAPGANTDAISDVTIKRDGTLRVWVSTAASSIVNVMLDEDGAVAEQTIPLNGNAALDGGGVFDVPVAKNDVVNIQVETDVALHYVVLDLVIHEAT